MATEKITTERVIVQNPVTDGPAYDSDNPIKRDLEQDYLGDKLGQLVYIVFGVVEVLLVFRIIFLLLNATRTGFVKFVYDITYPFVYPFLGIFKAPSAGGAYFDTAAILSMVVIAFLAWIIVAFLDLLFSKPK